MLENQNTIQLIHDLGRFADIAALQAQYPTGRPGDFARLTSTETIWNWTGAAWLDTLVDASTLTGGKVTFDNTDPTTLGNPPAGKTFAGTYNGEYWVKDENGNVEFYVTKDELREAFIKGAAYYLDGSSNLDIPDNPSLGFGTSDFTLWAMFKVSHKPLVNRAGILTKGSASNTDGAYGITLSSGFLIVGLRSAGGYTEYLTSYKTGKLYIIFGVFNRSGDLDVYINGQLSGSADISAHVNNNISSPEYNLLIGSGTYIGIAEPLQGDIYKHGMLNKALTAAQIADFSLNPESIPFELEGASNVEMIINGDFDTDSDWDKGSGWTIAAGKANYVASGGSPYLSQDIGVEYGKKYQIKISQSNIASASDGVAIYGGGGFLAIPRILLTTNGDFVFEVDWFGTGREIFIEGNLNETSVSVDNISFRKIGEVAAFHPSGIGHAGWKGKYGAFAQNNGATPFNLPANHAEADIINTTSTSPSVTPPKGYVVESISIKTKADLTAIAAQQAGSLDDLVTGKVLDGSGSEKSKTYRQIGDHEIFDGATTLNFTLTGNDANGTIITLTYKREE
ncbi:MAG: hypothetical protein QM504_10950 [Pseudomonadota bacterium]